MYNTLFQFSSFWIGWNKKTHCLAIRDNWKRFDFTVSHGFF